MRTTNKWKLLKITAQFNHEQSRKFECKITCFCDWSVVQRTNQIIVYEKCEVSRAHRDFGSQSDISFPHVIVRASVEERELLTGCAAHTSFHGHGVLVAFIGILEQEILQILLCTEDLDFERALRNLHVCPPHLQ